MKPIHLSITAFGAFADTVEIDFAALAPRGLFLVSGETGTGKTTIFDAMCWALYGTMPLKESHEVRSDHVEGSTRCEVSFTFESGGSRYCVTRNPEQLRPAARNPARTVKEAAAASLVHITGDDSSSATELVAGKVSEVARACEEIIGLDAAQFQRVVLLPQGEFNAFLLANSGDREKILERLFGGQIYDRIVDELKATRDSCQDDLGEAETAITTALDEARRHVAAADAVLADDEEHTADEEPPGRDALDAAVARLATALDRQRSDLEKASNRRASAQTRHDRATTGALRFDRAAELRVTLAELAEAAESVERQSAAAAVSAKARPIVVADDAASAAEAAHRDALAARDERRVSITTALAELGVSGDDLTPVGLQRRFLEVQSTLRADVDKLTRRRAAEEALAAVHKVRAGLDEQVAAVEADLKRATERVAEIDTGLPDLRAAATDLDSIRSRIATARQLTEDREALRRVEGELLPASEQRALAATTHRDLLRAFTDTQAPRLALTLDEGRPCPVCGSLEHPEPATSGSTPLVTWDEVTGADTRHTEADAKVRALEAQVSELRGRLGDAASVEPEVLRKRVTEAQAELDGAGEAAARVTRLEGERTTLTAALRQLGADVATLTERRARSDRELTDATDAVRSATEAAEGLDASAIEERSARLERLGAALDGYDELVDAVTRTASLVESREADLTARLHDGDHDDVASARSVLWSPEQEQAAVEAARAHRSEQERATGAMQALEDAGIPEERPDPLATKTTLENVDAERQRLETLVTSLEFNVDGARRALERSGRLDTGTAELRARAAESARAYQVCAKGGPGLPVPLKRWVLAAELDRITASANVHLAGMTNRRYALRRRRAQLDGRRSFGLDLEVDDTDTGRPRSTASLSGGEQFQASLALALGLADVISHGGTAGGQAFEALFVDEGFGSLSASALDDAVDTLNGLQRTGRMVGAITHVEALKDALHVGIEVTRRDDGRGSTLKVHY